jgi:small subunit ribosomal protein S20
VSTKGSTKLANIKSQKKRVLTNAKAQARNKAVRSSVKTAVRRVHESVAAGDKAAATERMQAANRALDKAASKGVIHKNQAANRKSGIAKVVGGMEG